MKLIKQIALSLVLMIGASSVCQAAFWQDSLSFVKNKLPAKAIQQPPVNTAPVQPASYLTKSWESLAKWWQNYKLEIKPYGLIELIRKYPVTAFGSGILASYTLHKIYLYYTYDLPNMGIQIQKAISQELLNTPGSSSKENFLLHDMHCCNLIEFLFCQKWKASLAEIVGGTRLVELIKEFYAAKKNWRGTSPITVGEPFEVSQKINAYLLYHRFVDRG